MGTVRNLSVRVPWHDQAWNGHVCSDPLANSSCLALKIIAERELMFRILHRKYAVVHFQRAAQVERVETYTITDGDEFPSIRGRRDGRITDRSVIEKSPRRIVVRPPGDTGIF